MKTLKNLTCLILLNFTTYSAFCQSTSATNAVVAPNTPFVAGVDFLGWSAFAPAIPLDIKTELNQPIYLHTNTGAVGFNNIRQSILGNYSATGGIIGIGDLGTTAAPTFAPFSLLHSYRVGNTDVYHQFSNDNTGFGAPPYSDHQGFQVGIRYDTDTLHYDPFGPIPPHSIAELRQWHNAPMDFYVNDLNNPTELPIRMRISYGKGSSHLPLSYQDPLEIATGVTKVLISHMGFNALDPKAFYPYEEGVAMLNLGENLSQIPSQSNPYIGGARLWMDVGTYYSFDSDNMYTGLKERDNNEKDAVVNWGDDPSASETVNHLLYIFSSAGGSTQAATVEGLEVGRMVAVDGNYGRMGIGGDPNLIATNFYHPQGSSTIEPGNTLEVNSPDIDATITAGGNSGLRFSDLNTVSATTPNPGMGILSVNQDGDVIYVPDIGNYCGEAVVRPLTVHYELPLDRFDYHFTGQSYGTTDVLVGSACTNPNPSAKFQSYQNINHSPGFLKSYAGLFSNTTDDKVAVGVEGSSLLSTRSNFGVVGLAQQYQGASNIGVFGSINGYAGLLAGNLNVGVYGFAQFSPVPNPPFPDYAVVGDMGIVCMPCLPNVAVTNPAAAGYFNGDVMFTTASYWVSDSALKENIQDMTDPMATLNQLNPKTYSFKRQQNESMQLSHGTHFGLLAQDVEPILPQLVKYGVHPARFDDSGNQLFPATEFKAINYTEIIPFLVAAVKEQQQRIDALQSQIDNCCGTGNRTNNEEEEETGKSLRVDLINSKTIILNQNVPNPFAEHTTISYFITDDIQNAKIIFYDNNGTVLKMVEIKVKGEGKLNVFAQDLSSGTYTYSLVADGKMIETKKMVKQN